MATFHFSLLQAVHSKKSPASRFGHRVEIGEGLIVGFAYPWGPRYPTFDVGHDNKNGVGSGRINFKPLTR